MAASNTFEGRVEAGMALLAALGLTPPSVPEGSIQHVEIHIEPPAVATVTVTYAPVGIDQLPALTEMAGKYHLVPVAEATEMAATPLAQRRGIGRLPDPPPPGRHRLG
jgi:hypothetical protein